MIVFCLYILPWRYRKFNRSFYMKREPSQAEAIKNGALKQQPAQPSIEDFIQTYTQNSDLRKRNEAIRAKNAAQNAAP
jgi:hypothetical protein